MSGFEWNEINFNALPFRWKDMKKSYSCALDEDGLNLKQLQEFILRLRKRRINEKKIVEYGILKQWELVKKQENILLIKN